MLCVCVGKPQHTKEGVHLVPTIKEGVYLFVSTPINRLDFSGLDFGALVGCLPFAPYHNFDNGCVIHFFILILLCLL